MNVLRSRIAPWNFFFFITQGCCKPINSSLQHCFRHWTDASFVISSRNASISRIEANLDRLRVYPHGERSRDSWSICDSVIKGCRKLSFYGLTSRGCMEYDDSHSMQFFKRLRVSIVSFGVCISFDCSLTNSGKIFWVCCCLVAVSIISEKI